MRTEVTLWAAVALLLMAAEAVIPGAFLLWMGFAAAAVFLGVLLVPGIPELAQVAAFMVLSFISIQIYLKLVRGKGRERESDHPTLNRRAVQHVGKVAALERAIHAGSGRVKIGDAFWTVEGPELPEGTLVRVVAVAANGVNLQVEAAAPPE